MTTSGQYITAAEGALERATKELNETAVDVALHRAETYAMLAVAEAIREQTQAVQ